MYQVSVLIANTPLSIDKPFTYLSEQCLSFGTLVKVSFAHRNAYGFVVEHAKKCLNEDGLKCIDEVINEYAFSKQQYDYACWLSSVCYKPINQLLNQMIIDPLRKANPFSVLSKNYYSVNQNYESKLTVKQDQLVSLIGSNQLAQDVLTNHFTSAFIKTCVEKGILNKTVCYPIVDKSNIKLDVDATLMYPMKKVCLVDNGFTHFKTHITPIIARQLKTNKRVLVLVANDTSLNIMKVLMDDLFTNIVCYSASLSNRDKLKAIYAFKHDANLTLATQAVLLVDNKYDCVIVIDSNARSYEYSSFAHVGLQRCLDYMAHNYGSQVINVSQTPSLAQCEDNALIHFDTNKVNVELVDMEMHYRKSKGIFAQQSIQAIYTALHQNKRCFVWVNRKGSYHVVKCGTCATVLTCPSCGRLLTYSDESNSYHCYACNKQYHFTNCPNCGCSKFSYSNVGVERVVKVLSHYFPDSSIVICDSDHPYYASDIDKNTILVGTNAILNNPLISWDLLIGIDVDSYYSNKDYHSNERGVYDCFSLVNRCSCTAILQVNDINHPYNDFIKHNDYFGFITFEKSFRKQANLPPYSNEIIIKLSVKDTKDPLLTTIDVTNQHIRIYGPNWIDNHTVEYSMYCQNPVLLDQYMQQLVKNNKNIWKNKVEISVGPYNR